MKDELGVRQMTSKLKHKLECIASKVLHINIIQVIHIENFYKKYSFGIVMGLTLLAGPLAILIVEKM